MRLITLTASIAAAALMLVVPAIADQSYSDSTGEVAGSADISTVAVTDSTAGTVTFVVTTNLAAMDDTTLFGVAVVPDSGIEPYLIATVPDGTYVIDPIQQTATPVAAESFANGVWTVTVADSTIGYPTAFGFAVVTDVGPDPQNPLEDIAPDTGGWSYTLVNPVANPTPTLTVTTPSAPAPASPPFAKPKPVIPQVSYVSAVFAGKPTAGKTFVVSRLTVNLSTGVSVSAKALHCSAKLGGKAFKGGGAAGCAFKLPTSAKGEPLVLSVRGRYRTIAVSSTLRFKVR